MVQLKLLILAITFYELMVNLDARQTCPKGQSVTRNRPGCEICPNETYQPTENDSHYCKACTRCDRKSGSDVIQKCTKEANTICQCRGEFVPWENDSSSCKCNIGFGLEGGVCSKCKYGYFSSGIDSPCQKWRGCECGVKMTGNNTADVTCKAETCSDASDIYITPTTPNKLLTLITHLTNTSTSSTSAPPGHTVSSDNRQPDHPSDTSATYTGMTFLLFGIIGLLVLTAVTCKLHVTPQPAAPENDSLCQKPVEESGEDSPEDSSLSSRKPSLEEH